MVQPAVLQKAETDLRMQETSDIEVRKRRIHLASDYYDILGISKGATDDELKKAFRTKVKQYHPDLHPGDAEAEAKFKEVNEAYSVLSDKDKRARYDQFMQSRVDGNAGYGGAGGFGGFSEQDLKISILVIFSVRSSEAEEVPAEDATDLLRVRISNTA